MEKQHVTFGIKKKKNVLQVASIVKKIKFEMSTSWSIN